MAQVLGDNFEKIVTLFSGDKPYGEDSKYDDMYIDLKNEILKLTAMSSKETTIDWKAIKQWSIEILATKSKSILNSRSFNAGNAGTAGEGAGIHLRP